MLRTLIGSMVLVALAAVDGRAQLAYDGTSFMHGFHDGPYRWTWHDSPGILQRDVDLRDVDLPWLNGDASVVNQASELRNDGWLYNNRVLTALSMGGLVAREAYLQNPANIAGIVTAGTPHHGAPIADVAQRVSYSSARGLADYTSVLIDLVYSPASGLGSMVFALFIEVVERNLTEIIRSEISDRFALETPALQDLKTTSPAIARLSSTQDQAPHASVYGVIPRRNAIFRTLYSSANMDHKFWNHMRAKNQLKSVVKACRQVLYNIIIRTSLGRLCNKSDRALGSIDGRWAAWTFGNTPGTASDGLIPAERTRYPGTSLSNATVNFRADGANHFDLQYHPEGTGKIVAAMLEIRMRRPNVVDRVVVAPASAELAAGSSLQLQATAYDWNNASLPDKPIAWLSENTTIATVSSTGLVTGRTGGTTTVRASIDAVVATMALTVTGVAPPPELYAWISGTDTVRTADPETWSAEVSGGDGQYTYRWEYQAGGSSTWTVVGADPAVTLAIDPETRDFVLRLTVTSAGMTRTSEVTIMNRCHSSFGQACFLG